MAKCETEYDKIYHLTPFFRHRFDGRRMNKPRR
jgi:hypothetical protein